MIVVPIVNLEVQVCRRLSINLILMEIIKQYELKPDADKLHSMVANLSTAYEQPDEAIKLIYKDRKRLD